MAYVVKLPKSRLETKEGIHHLYGYQRVGTESTTARTVQAVRTGRRSADGRRARGRCLATTNSSPVEAGEGVSLERYLSCSLSYDPRAVGDADARAFLEGVLDAIERAPELLLRTYR